VVVNTQNALRIVCWSLLALWLWSVQLHAADSASTDAFVGCYRAVSLCSKPSDQQTGGIPAQFALTNQATIFGHRWLQLTASTATAGPARLHHLWRPDGRKVTVQFGWGMGGWTGTLKQSGVNEFSGKLRAFVTRGVVARNRLLRFGLCAANARNEMLQAESVEIRHITEGIGGQ
jgi:hypothetical protein